MLMAIFVAYSISGITSEKKFYMTSKWRSFWRRPNIKHSFSLIEEMKNYARKNTFIVMTSSMTSHIDLKVVSLYSLMNDKITFLG